ncbi:MAG: GatB/YqeY domain-containing protein [Chloroflexota bacterium]
MLTQAVLLRLDALLFCVIDAPPDATYNPYQVSVLCTSRMVIGVTLQDQVMEDLKTAMRAGDEPRREAIRMLRAAIKNEEISRGHALTDAEVLEVVARQARRYRESIEEFTKANRLDLVGREAVQLKSIEGYLPTLEPASSFESLIRQAIHDSGVSDVKDQGKVMGRLAPQLRGKTDMGEVGQIVRRILEEGS